MALPTRGDSPRILVELGDRLSLAEGEVAPVVATFEVGSAKASLPLGAFTVKEGRSRFVATVDVVGLVAVVLGIRLGRVGLKALAPLIEALAHRIERPRALG